MELPIRLTIGIPVGRLEGGLIVHSNSGQSSWVCDNQLFSEILSLFIIDL